MLFKDLLITNKNWFNDCTLIVIDRDQSDLRALEPRLARSIYGDRNVCWFREDVVVLM